MQLGNLGLGVGVMVLALALSWGAMASNSQFLGRGLQNSEAGPARTEHAAVRERRMTFTG